jgi:NDP-sugar pyrophosphorylase family protein
MTGSIDHGHTCTAYLLAAGLGSRLKPLTEHTPKPLVPLCGVPLLAYNLALCGRHGLTRVLVNVHHLADQFAGWEGEHEGVMVKLSREPEIMGTGGSLRAAVDAMAPAFAVVNGDVVSDVDLGSLLAAVPSKGAALALRSAAEEIPLLGSVAADEDGIVVRIKDFAITEAWGAVDETTHFTGVHAIDRRILPEVPVGFCCIIRTLYRALVPRRRLRAYRHDGLWLEITDAAAYHAANMMVLRGEITPPLDPVPRAAWCRSGMRTTGSTAVLNGACVRGSAWVGSGAAIGRSVTLEDSIVGTGATVPRATTLERTVVWSGVRVPEGRHSSCIIHPGGVLPVA